MKEIIKAIYEQLTGSSIASASYCSDRIYYGIAPFNTATNNTKYKNPTFPYMTFIKIGEDEEFTQISDIETYLFQFDIYDNDTSAITIETIAGLLNALFNLKSADFSITGYNLIFMKKLTGQTIKTQQNNWRHISRYQIQTQNT